MNNQRGRWSGGLFLIAIGAFFMLNQLGYIDMDLSELIRTFWPVILILIGFNALIHGAFWGLILLGIGGYFQLSTLGILTTSVGSDMRLLVPFILIMIGVGMLIRPRKDRHRDKYRDRRDRNRWDEGHWHEQGSQTDRSYREPRPLDDDFDQTFNKHFKQDGVSGMPPGYNEDGSGQKWDGGKRQQDDFSQSQDRSSDYDPFKYAGSVPPPPPPPPPMGDGSRGGTMNKGGFIGDIHLGSDYWELKPMNISHFIGDTVIDLTKAQVPYGDTKINISSFIGDVKVYVPNDMDLGVIVNSSSFLGDVRVFNQEKEGFMNNLQVETPYFYEAGKKVRITVSTFIGDVKVMKVG